jgi:hypothetical protein
MLSPRVRRALGARRRRLVDVGARIDPTPLLLGSAPDTPGCALICVYRRQGAGHVRALIDGLPASAVRLWSLDGEVPPELAGMTVGTGPGGRLVLLNRLFAALPPGAATAGLVIADDDVRVEVGTLGLLVDIARRLELDVCQPAHLATSHSSWQFTRRRFLTVARLTTFVEQGPLLLLSSAAQDLLLPMPEDLGMGWGVEVRWSQQAAAAGLRLGIVDAVGILHQAPAGGAYDRAVEEAVLAAEVSRAGLRDLRDLHRELHRTRPWHRTQRVAGSA